MQMARHTHERMNQRAIRSELVALAMDIGEFEGITILTRKAIDIEAVALRQRLKALEGARKKGGLTVVAESDCLITTFAGNTLNSDCL